MERRSSRLGKPCVAAVESDTPPVQRAGRRRTREESSHGALEASCNDLDPTTAADLVLAKQQRRTGRSCQRTPDRRVPLQVENVQFQPLT
eukprot:3536867-Prymnesium_polylepis.1